MNIRNRQKSVILLRTVPMVKITVINLLFTMFGCKGAPLQTAADIETLLSEGNCIEIESRLANNFPSPSEKGALSACRLFASSNAPQKDVVLQMVRAEDAETAETNAEALLKMAALYPSPRRDGQMAAVEIVFGLGGFGPFQSSQSIAPGTPEATQLVIAILKFTHTSYLSGTAPNMADMTQIWEGCSFLLNGSYSCNNDLSAWQLYTQLAAVALRIWDPLNKTELAVSLMTATIATIEQNPPISVAARCDLGAPYEDLKSALSKDISLIGPLERAVSAAIGCTRGKYAPQE